MKLKDIKIRVTNEQEIRETHAALVSLGYTAPNDADFYVSQRAVWLYGEANKYVDFQEGEFCLEWDDCVSHGWDEPNFLVTVDEVKKMAENGTTEIDEPQTITILWSEYKDLQRAARELDALENHGVDNWQGYGEAMKEAYQDEDEDA